MKEDWALNSALRSRNRADLNADMLEGARGCVLPDLLQRPLSNLKAAPLPIGNQITNRLVSTDTSGVYKSSSIAPAHPPLPARRRPVKSYRNGPLNSHA